VNAVSLTDLEKQHIARILKETGWNITRAASLLGIDRATLYKKIKKYGIER
jgi:transcriptional regulator of acetoin/glycerol metabolism